MYEIKGIETPREWYNGKLCRYPVSLGPDVEKAGDDLARKVIELAKVSFDISGMYMIVSKD